MKQVTRTQIETVLDEYDELGSEEFQKKHSKTDRPKKYWFLPSTNRRYSKYPTRSIVEVATGLEHINSGWDINQSCTILHNIGYIIVGKDGEITGHPVKNHVLTGNSWTILCAKNNFIDPARERGENTAQINIENFCSRILRSNRIEHVVELLTSLEFQEAAGVYLSEELISNTENVRQIVYKLKAVSPTLENLIFYGPPGTGKTYNAIFESVKLCIGVNEANQIKGNSREIFKMYQKLSKQGKIEFITFHQSFSYEEFIEGLRPKIESVNPNSINTSSGFSLTPHDGVFLKFCKQDKTLFSHKENAQILDRSRSVYQINLDRSWLVGNYTQYCVENSIIHIELLNDVDWNGTNFYDLDEFMETWKEIAGDGEIKGHLKQDFDYLFNLKENDYIVITEGREKFVALGIVKSPYYFDYKDELARHRRNVYWLWKDLRGKERTEIYSSKFLNHSIYKLVPSKINWDAMEKIISDVDSISNKVLIIDEINRSNISKVFGELLTLLETDKRVGASNELRVRLPYSGQKFGVPSNLFIIGTMNTADRSIALLDTALRRRFRFIELMPNPELVPNIKIGNVSLREFFSLINKRIEYLYDREHLIGHSYFMNCKTEDDVERVMRRDIIPLLAEYFFEDRSKIAIILGDYTNSDETEIDGCFLKTEILKPEDLGIDYSEFFLEPKIRWSIKGKFNFLKLNLP